MYYYGKILCRLNNTNIHDSLISFTFSLFIYFSPKWFRNPLYPRQCSNNRKLLKGTKIYFEQFFIIIVGPTKYGVETIILLLGYLIAHPIRNAQFIICCFDFHFDHRALIDNNCLIRWINFFIDLDFMESDFEMPFFRNIFVLPLKIK